MSKTGDKKHIHNHREQEGHVHHNHQHHDHSAHEEHGHQHHDHSGHGGHGGGHGDHHEHMIEDFKKRFWISIVLTIPIAYLSEMIQILLGYEVNFSVDTFLLFLISTIIFLYCVKHFFI